MHVVKLIRRRTPNQAGTIIALLALLSGSAVLIGIGLLLLF